MIVKRIPPMSANLGQACYTCFRDEGANVTLQRCGKCRRVSYCGSECQKADWSQHKAICKALNALENNEAMRQVLLFSASSAPQEDAGLLNMFLSERANNEINFLKVLMKRELKLPEQNLMGWEPRCLGCGLSDRLMRMEARGDSIQKARILNACSTCKTSFYCCESHWDAVKDKHMGEPCDDGHDGLSQCQINQEIRQDITFLNTMDAPMQELKPSAKFQWAPTRTKTQWSSLQGLTWYKEFRADLVKELDTMQVDGLIGPWIRASSDSLSMPMSILWILENLHGNSSSWTRQETMTIHIMGARDLELSSGSIFEEILHRLPDVQNLELVFCGPEVIDIVPLEGCNKAVPMDTCPECQKRGRKRIHWHQADTYHEYAKKRGSKFMKPDLAIAFNSGCSQDSRDSWNKTITFLVQRQIPSAFTAYNREEAEAESKMLTTAGATIVPSLEPKKNIWGSLLTKTEPNNVVNFYAVNGWLAGGFK